MKQEILVKLKDAENDTARRIEQAKERAQELLKEARRQADDIRRDAQAEARREQEDQLQKERARLIQQREKILADGDEKVRTVRAHYQKQVDRFVEKAQDAFSRSLDGI